MIPIIDFQRHDVLTRVFLSPSKKREDFEKRSRIFIKHFKRIEKKVLFLIEKVSGFKWSKRKIPVYLVPSGKHFSFAKSRLEGELPGVVQKVYENPKTSTHILIHELTHINQFQSDFYSRKNSFIFEKDGTKNLMKIEVCTDIVCLFVLREIFGKNSDYEKDYWKFQKIRITMLGMDKTIRKYLKKLDLNKKPLREYTIN